MLSQKHHCDYMKQRAVHLRKGLVMIVVWLVCFHNESQAQKLVAIPETSLIMYGTVRNTANRNAQIISGTLVCRREDAWRDKPGTITPASGSPDGIVAVCRRTATTLVHSSRREPAPSNLRSLAGDSLPRWPTNQRPAWFTRVLVTK